MPAANPYGRYKADGYEGGLIMPAEGLRKGVEAELYCIRRGSFKSSLTYPLLQLSGLKAL